MTISERVVRLIELLGITKAQAAEEMNTSPQTLQNISKGRTTFPSSELLFNWKASRPDINLNWLIAGIGDPLIDLSQQEPTFRNLHHLDKETLITMVQAGDDMTKILTERLADKDKIIKVLEDLLKSNQP